MLLVGEIEDRGSRFIQNVCLLDETRTVY